MLKKKKKRLATGQRYNEVMPFDLLLGYKRSKLEVCTIPLHPQPLADLANSSTLSHPTRYSTGSLPAPSMSFREPTIPTFNCCISVQGLP